MIMTLTVTNAASQSVCHPRSNAGNRNYTMAELLIVIFIIVLLMSLVLPRLLKMPTGPAIKKNLATIERPFREAALRARVTGHPVTLTLDAGNGVFRLGDRNYADTKEYVKLNNEGQQFKTSEPDTKGKTQPRVYSLGDDITWTSQVSTETEQNKVLFLFYPNREAGGPKLNFKCRQRNFRLSVDRLTGELNIAEVTDEL